MPSKLPMWDYPLREEFGTESAYETAYRLWNEEWEHLNPTFREYHFRLYAPKHGSYVRSLTVSGADLKSARKYARQIWKKGAIVHVHDTGPLVLTEVREGTA